jgi:hypothetical protein
VRVTRLVPVHTYYSTGDRQDRQPPQKTATFVHFPFDIITSSARFRSNNRRITPMPSPNHSGYRDYTAYNAVAEQRASDHARRTLDLLCRTLPRDRVRLLDAALRHRDEASALAMLRATPRQQWALLCVALFHARVHREALCTVVRAVRSDPLVLLDLRDMARAFGDCLAELEQVAGARR